MADRTIKKGTVVWNENALRSEIQLYCHLVDKALARGDVSQAEAYRARLEPLRILLAVVTTPEYPKQLRRWKPHVYIEPDQNDDPDDGARFV